MPDGGASQVPVGSIAAQAGETQYSYRVRWVVWVLWVAGCFHDEVRPEPPLPARYDSGSCHVRVLAKPPPEDVKAIGRVRVFADMERIDERWALEALAAQACTYGANAILPDRETEAVLPRLARRIGANYVTFEADAFELPDQ